MSKSTLNSIILAAITAFVSTTPGLCRGSVGARSTPAATSSAATSGVSSGPTSGGAGPMAGNSIVPTAGPTSGGTAPNGLGTTSAQGTASTGLAFPNLSTFGFGGGFGNGFIGGGGYGYIGSGAASTQANLQPTYTLPRLGQIAGPMQILQTNPYATSVALGQRTMFTNGVPTTVTESIVTEYNWPHRRHSFARVRKCATR